MFRTLKLYNTRLLSVVGGTLVGGVAGGRGIGAMRGSLAIGSAR